MSDINRSVVYIDGGKYYQLTFSDNIWRRCAVMIFGALDYEPVNLVISFYRMSPGGYSAKKSYDFNHSYITFYTDNKNLFMKCNNPADSPNVLLIYSFCNQDKECKFAQLIDPNMFNLTPVTF